MKYLIAEKFKSVQGEGVYAGTPMAFIRFVGCSVGKKICSACDTDFEKPLPWFGGGEFTLDELAQWVDDFQHICLTGGEPFDNDLLAFEERFCTGGRMLHVETSGTKMPTFSKFFFAYHEGVRERQQSIWLCVSPKPGFKEELIDLADEVKVIVPGLGVMKHGDVEPAIKLGSMNPVEHEDGGLDVGPRQILRWPTLEDALRWADAGKTVFLQPRNAKFEVDKQWLNLCEELVLRHPNLRLSTQLHKILHVR